MEWLNRHESRENSQLLFPVLEPGRGRVSKRWPRPRPKERPYRQCSAAVEAVEAVAIIHSFYDFYPLAEEAEQEGCCDLCLVRDGSSIAGTVRCYRPVGADFAGEESVTGRRYKEVHALALSESSSLRLQAFL